jgi:hypothetical protein
MIGTSARERADSTRERADLPIMRVAGQVIAGSVRAVSPGNAADQGGALFNDL